MSGSGGIIMIPFEKITDFISVIGTDKTSTVGLSLRGKSVYWNKTLTENKVVAKTGTIGTNITLGGAINTINGLVYFMFNVEVSSMAEENKARALIASRLFALVKQTPGVIEFDYESVSPVRDCRIKKSPSKIEDDFLFQMLI